MKEEFVDYVFSFYGPGEIYANNFNHQLTREQVEFGVAILKQHCYKNGIEFMGDSYDRKYTLSIMLFWYVYKYSLSDIYAFLKENYCNTDEN